MNLGQIINKAAYGTIGYAGSHDDLLKIDTYFAYNKDVINQYAYTIIATNFDNEELISLHNTMCKHHFPDCILLNSINNRGHNFGTADLDNIIFNYCKENNIEWLCKSSNDVVIHIELLDKEVDEADFYYFNGIGYGGLVKYNFDNDRIIDEYFFPQTNFYLINVSKTDYLNNQDFINSTYEYVTSIEDYNGKIWEYVAGWACEQFLADCVNRNNLKKYHLLNNDTYISLLNFIKECVVHDPSHKNIMMENVCHMHFSEQDIVYI
jgi:hypothetical protein